MLLPASSSPADIQSWRDRWKRISEMEAEELRNTSPDTTLRQLNALYGSLDVMGWREKSRPDEERVRNCWARLREKYGVRKR